MWRLALLLYLHVAIQAIQVQQIDQPRPVHRRSIDRPRMVMNWATIGSPEIGASPWDHSDWDATERPPNVVVVGFGDSGTRGIKVLLEQCGLYFCSETNDEHDNIATRSTHHYTRFLLNASDGEVNTPLGYQLSAYFPKAVVAEQRGGTITRKCIGDDYNLKPHDDFPWGFKNPAHLLLVPVTAAAFNRPHARHAYQRFLAVARDPRDICTGPNQNQLGLYGGMILKDGIPDAQRGNFDDQQAAAAKHDCPLFWATVWNATLAYHSSTNLRIVRIEQLLHPEPDRSSKSYQTAQCIMRHVKLRPDPNTLISQLRIMANFSSSYMGNRFANDTASKTSIENQFAQRTDARVIHKIMLDLGYDVKRYGLVKPRSEHVCAL